MKICITSKGETLDSEIDPRFGRSQYFIFIDTEGSDFEVVKNPKIDAAGGAGIDSAILVAKKGVKALLSGHCGPNAFHTLQAAGIEVFIGLSGKVKEAIEKYKKGDLKPAPGPDVMPEFGTRKENDFEL